MRIITTVCILLFLVITPALVYSAEEKKEGTGLDVLADELKFQNGVEFVKNKMYGKALETFNEYLEIYINGTHRNEAYKFIAEIYFNRMEYQKAANFYRSLYEEYSTADSGIEAYLNIGICYTKMGYDQKAADIFNDIVENHPESTFRSQAELQLNVLNILQEK
jgi:TolA-binding protein